MTSLAYEYSVTGHQAQNTFFFGGGPSYFRGRARGTETLDQLSNGRFLVSHSTSSIWTLGLATCYGSDYMTRKWGRVLGLFDPASPR